MGGWKRGEGGHSNLRHQLKMVAIWIFSTVGLVCQYFVQLEFENRVAIFLYPFLSFFFATVMGSDNMVGVTYTHTHVIYIYMQMGTIWDYSINNSHCISRDFLPNAMFGSRPQRSKEKTAALRHAFLKRWRRQRKTSSN